jgi:thiol-disulfide isomerase/thioredoxin
MSIAINRVRLRRALTAMSMGVIIMLLPGVAGPQVALADGQRAPGFAGTVRWLNSPPLDNKALRGKVVLVNFWTYSCINSLRELPYMKVWATKYKDAGLVVIGVHTPEFSFERDNSNVEWAVRDYKVTYPVAVDTEYGVWRAFNNNYWPANYLIDGKGRIRFHYFGEGAYQETERVIQELLKENGAAVPNGNDISVSVSQVEAPPSGEVQSPETYVGYGRAERFASHERFAEDARRVYNLPAMPALNQWGLGGAWNVSGERALLQTQPGKIAFRFHSRDLHMVLGPSKSGQAIRFRVTLDGETPGADRGSDTSADGTGMIQEPRLYQLIRQKGEVHDKTFTIEFLDPGVQAFSFTFG